MSLIILFSYSSHLVQTMTCGGASWVKPNLQETLLLQITAALERRGAVASMSLTVAIQTAGYRCGDQVRQPSQSAQRSASASATATLLEASAAHVCLRLKGY